MRSVTARGGAGLTALGLLVLLAGTFLPWLRSGSVSRDSYQSVSALRGLPSPPTGAENALLYSWLAVIPLCAICIALYALNLRRPSAVVACLASLLVVVASIIAMTRPDASGSVGFSPIGPTVTLAGAALALIGGIIVIREPRAREVSTSGGEL
ncbi:MAG TPA: hypothetical protein VHX38_05460 [Pseudonocardiaceae bacterium]|jgi:hypothetical protein|nr:hypothetical protein [Pseudonocardiaceae bacterium]